MRLARKALVRITRTLPLLVLAALAALKVAKVAVADSGGADIGTNAAKITPGDELG